MSQLWVNSYKSHEYTTRTEKFIYKTKGHCSYVNYLWPNIHSRVPFGIHIVYGHIWHFLFVAMYITPKWFKSVVRMWHSPKVLPGSESHTEYWFVFLLHYIILGSTIHLVESIHVMITYHSTYYPYYPTAVSSLFPDPCLLFMCTPEGSTSMNVAFNLLFSVTLVCSFPPVIILSACSDCVCS